MSAPHCERCIVGRVFWLHDQASEAHLWQGHESACVCHPEPICALCDFEHLHNQALLLGKRLVPFQSAPVSGLRH